MWKLSTDQDGKREYTNSVTGSKCITTLCYTDKEGNKWWAFNDLAALPYTRNFEATKITALFSLGLKREDLNEHITGMKTILRSVDKDKYEKAFASVLNLESKVNNATDTVKQISSLVCVYFTLNDEPIDSLSNDLQVKKISLLEADTDMHTFFLNNLTESTEHFTSFLNSILQTVSQPEIEQPKVSD